MINCCSPMRNQAIRAILYPLICICEISTAFISKCIQWAIAEKAVEIFNIFYLVAGKIFTFFVLEKACSLIFFHKKSSVAYILPLKSSLNFSNTVFFFVSLYPVESFLGLSIYSSSNCFKSSF